MLDCWGVSGAAIEFPSVGPVRSGARNGTCGRAGCCSGDGRPGRGFGGDCRRILLRHLAHAADLVPQRPEHRRDRRSSRPFSSARLSMASPRGRNSRRRSRRPPRRRQAASRRTCADAERVLSSAWVQYVQAIKKPTTGMIYAYPVLQPQGSRPDEILLTAAAAPSLPAYLASTSDVNSIYKQLRDTAWAEAQASGNMTPDPRLLANLDRVRSLPAKGRFLLVDSGSSMLTLYQDGQPVDSMKVITGTSELPTPLIASYMYYITYNPYWHAPDHLVRKTIAPNLLRGGMTYLKSHGYHVIEDWSETPGRHRSDHGRLEGRRGRQGPSQDPAGSGTAQFNGNPQIPVPQSAGYLSPRHAGSREVRAGEPQSQQRLRACRGCEAARPLAARAATPSPGRRAGDCACSCRGRRRST